MTSSIASWGLLLLSLLALMVKTEASLLHPYMIHIPDRGMKCVSEKVNAAHPTLNVLWEVSTGPSFLIDVQVTAENKKVVWQETAEEGSKEITDLTIGMYKVCFINHDAGDPGYKEVSFHVKSGPAKVATVGLPIEEGIEALEVDLRGILSSLDHLTLTMERHKSLVETTHSSWHFWNWFLLIASIVLAYLRVMFIKRGFDDPKQSHRRHV